MDEKLPRTIWSSGKLVDTLKSLNASAKAQQEFSPPFELSSTRPDLATRRLIANLAFMYTAETGEDATVWRHHDHGEPRTEKHGKSDSRFLRVACAMFDLLGKSRGREGIATAIQQCRRMGSFASSER